MGKEFGRNLLILKQALPDPTHSLIKQWQSNVLHFENDFNFMYLSIYMQPKKSLKKSHCLHVFPSLFYSSSSCHLQCYKNLN